MFERAGSFGVHNVGLLFALNIILLVSGFLKDMTAGIGANDDSVSVGLEFFVQSMQRAIY